MKTITDIISPIAIDLGAKTTGLFTTSYTAGEALDSTQIQFNGKTVEVGKNITFAQGPRTVKRHQRRGFARRKLAKRLFQVIMKSDFNIDLLALPKKEREAVFGLFNRRGFTYFQEEIDEELLRNADLSPFVDFYPTLIRHDGNLLDQLILLTKTP